MRAPWCAQRPDGLQALGLYGLAGIAECQGALLLKFTGIIYRNDEDGTLRHASLSDSFVCLGDVKVIQDPENQLECITLDVVSLVNSVEGPDKRIHVSGQTVNVTISRNGLPGKAIVSQMLRNPEGLNTVQAVIDVHRKFFERPGFGRRP